MILPEVCVPALRPQRRRARLQVALFPNALVQRAAIAYHSDLFPHQILQRGAQPEDVLAVVAIQR